MVGKEEEKDETLKSQKRGEPKRTGRKNRNDEDEVSINDSLDELKENQRKKVNRSHKHSRRRRSPSPSSESVFDSDSEYSSSGTDSESEADSEEDDVRKKRKKKEKEREKERERSRKRKRRKEKEREKEKDRKRKRGKDKEHEDKAKKKKKKEVGKRPTAMGAVTNSWGKYGIIRETDMWNKRPEFTAWLSEVKQVNLETLPNWEEKQMFKEFMEDHNTATFPSKKYYNLDEYHRKMMMKEQKRGLKIAMQSERTVFDDEEQRRQELMRERERHKEQQVEALKRTMQSGMAQDMKEQAKLREEMNYQFRLGNYEAAAAIQRRLNPDPPA